MFGPWYQPTVKPREPPSPVAASCPVRMAGTMALVLLALAAFPDCPDQPDGCGGTAVERAAESRRRAREVDLDRPWQDVRDSLVRACGLLVGQSTSHCFDDFNHVACCAMAASQHHKTNEESRVGGMHTVNYLGEHIIAASDPELGEGG